jgi:uncharacterized protein (TIGR02231 family)
VPLPPPGASSEALRRAALQLMDDGAALQRQIADVDDATHTLEAAIAHAPHRGESWRTVRFDLSTAHAATLRVRYQVRDVQWKPSYRATLDAAAGTVRLERQAEIVQGSGEDWSQVALTLSTASVRRAPGGLVPSAWTLERAEAVESISAQDIGRFPDALQRVPGIKQRAPAPVSEDKYIDDTPLPTIAVAQNAFDTSFPVSLPVSLPSDGQPHTLSLETQVLPARLFDRASPRQQPTAWLVADLPRPAGVWPTAPVQLWRDGHQVGVSPWPGDETARLELPFGRDERVRVAVTSPASMTAGTGLFGSRKERRWGQAFTITNEHDKPIELEVLDATPVSTDEKIQVAATFAPQPSEHEWRGRSGVVAWRTQVAPRGATKIDESYVVSWPADMVVSALP